jgi:hypothetical protein
MMDKQMWYFLMLQFDLEKVVGRTGSESHIRTSGHGESEKTVDQRRFMEQTVKKVSQQPL